MANIKEWYTKKYPTDELGTKIKSSATFKKAVHNLDRVYDFLGVHDSLVRERVFEELAKREGVTYDEIYNNWLNS